MNTTSYCNYKNSNNKQQLPKIVLCTNICFIYKILQILNNWLLRIAIKIKQMRSKYVQGDSRSMIGYTSLKVDSLH